MLLRGRSLPQCRGLGLQLTRREPSVSDNLEDLARREEIMDYLTFRARSSRDYPRAAEKLKQCFHLLPPFG